MLSRVAESLYWTGRYIERAEDTSRLAARQLPRRCSTPTSPTAGAAWQDLHPAAAAATSSSASTSPTTRAQAVTEFMLWHPANPDAVTACVARARENARGVREQISSEMWEHLNRLHLLVSRTRPAAVLASPHAFFVRIREASHAFQGVMKATLPRGEAYEFLELGAHLERADTTTRLLAVKVPGAAARRSRRPSRTPRSRACCARAAPSRRFRKQVSDELRAARVRRVPAARAQPAARGALLPRAEPQLDPGDLGRGGAARARDRPPLRRARRSPTCPSSTRRPSLLLERVMQSLADAADEIAARLLHDPRRPARPLRPAAAAAAVMYLRVEHTTEFTYDAPDRRGLHRAAPAAARGRRPALLVVPARRPSRSACASASTTTTSATTSSTSTCSSPHDRLVVTAVSDVMTPDQLDEHRRAALAARAARLPDARPGTRRSPAASGSSRPARSERERPRRGARA